MLKQRNLFKYAFVCCILTSTFVTNACTIFMANDGKNVWIGNNEDEVQTTRYRMWFYPAQKHSYGYAIWTDLNFGKLLKGISYLNPQGGLNEFGLFMDYTATDGISVVIDDQKKNRKKQVVTDILKRCKTVEEALAYLSKYNLIKLKYAQLFIGDATGNYAVVTGGYVVRKTDNSFALTNYCVNDGRKEACHRRDVAAHYLNTSTTFQLDDIASILKKSSVKFPNNSVTNYSMAVNLKTSTIYLYYKHDFTAVSVLSLSEELKKGKHHKEIQHYFPESIVPVIETAYKNNGINSAIEQYKALRKQSSEKYNFKNDDVLNLAIGWIEKGETNDALKLLECLKVFDPTNTTIYSWLGVANRKNDNPEEGNKYFSKVLEQNPNDYLATLFGKQDTQKITFKLNDFEDAERVLLIGDFTEWLKNPIKMKKENGYWTCEVTLPKGENKYKFVVNDQYLADSKNYMNIGTGPEIFSKLYVW
jgi:tetratricopeptide (TPR) repeat protein